MRRLVIVGGVVPTRDLQDYDYDNDKGEMLLRTPLMKIFFHSQ